MDSFAQLSDLINQHKTNSNSAIIFDDKEISFNDLYASAYALAREIKNSLGLEHQIIGIFIPGSIDYCISYLAITLSGNIIFPFSINQKKDEFRRTISYLPITCIITNQRYVDTLRKKHELSNLSIIDVSGYVYQSASLINFTSEIVSALENVALILQTSGSYYAPKSVMLTHKNLISCASSIINSLGINASDKSLIVLPMQYGSANTSQFLTHLYVGGCIFFSSRIFSPQSLFFNLNKYGITNFTCVPTVAYHLLNQKQLLNDNSLDSLRYICYGGAPSNQESIGQLISNYPHIQFIHMYGQTEASTRVSHYFEPLKKRKAGCVGKPIPGVHLRIVDGNGNTAGAFQRGEIVVTGENVMKGYFLRPEETRMILKDSELYTGDIGYLDSSGNLFITGRKKNIIIKGGENIYPEEIEDVLLSHQDILEAQVVGEEDDLWGEIPIAYLVVKTESETECFIREIQTFCMQRLSNHKVPQALIFVNEFQKTNNGKIIRGAQYDNAGKRTYKNNY